MAPVASILAVIRRGDVRVFNLPILALFTTDQRSSVGGEYGDAARTSASLGDGFLVRKVLSIALTNANIPPAEAEARYYAAQQEVALAA